MQRTYAATRRSLLASTFLLMGAPAYAQAKPLYRDATAPVVVRVRDLLSRMTLEEKVAQMLCMWQSKGAILDDKGEFSPTKAAVAIANGIGQIGRPGDTSGTSRRGATRFRERGETIVLVNAIQKFLVEKTRLGIPALFHEETAHGYRARNATMFPIPPGLASTWDPELIEQAFTVVGREARLGGATVALSPVIDLARDPRFGRVEEFFSEDPYLTAQMGIASVRGQQGHARPLAKDRLFATLKHFVHGTPQGGINIAPADVSDRTLRENFLVPFDKVIKQTDPAIVMPSYNEVEGVPAHASGDLLQAVGRQRLGFKGAYFSDYSGIANLHRHHNIAANNDEAAILALEAGVDADLPDAECYRNLAALVKAGRVSEAKIDAAVARILAMKFEAGLFENPYVDLKAADRGTNQPADIVLARKVAQKSLILLKNDGLAPLDANASLKLAVIGPNAEEALTGGYSAPNVKNVGVLAGIKAAAGKGLVVEHAEGVRISDGGVRAEHLPSAPIVPVPKADNEARIAKAVELAQRSDVIVLVVGDVPEITREALDEHSPGDRNTLGLYGDQDQLVEALIATGKPLIALLINGRPLAVTRLAEKANALFEGWYLGQEGGNAFADVLFGKVNPGGKLPVTVPRSVGDLPVFYNRHPSTNLHDYVEGKSPPLFPFGHGLSYTRFEIAAPRVTKPSIGAGETVKVEVDVTNIGAVAGDEVVQLYIRDDLSSVPRPILELKRFRRVTLKAGEKQTVTFDVGPDELAFWAKDMTWKVEPGSFTISAGGSSASLKSAKLTVV